MVSSSAEVSSFCTLGGLLSKFVIASGDNVTLGAPRPLFCDNADFCGAGIWLGDGETVEVGATAPLGAGVGNDAVSDGEGDGDFSSS